MKGRAQSIRRASFALLKEPALHFFVIGALLFAAHRWFGGDSRTIVVSASIKSEVARRFTDHFGRRPNPAEFERAVRDWKHDEALYREALREGLEREDATIRQVLAGKLRARAASEFVAREPSPAELEQWRESHRALYETPLRYEFEFAAFAGAQPAAPRELESFERALASAENPAALGRPLIGGTLTPSEIGERFGVALAQRVPQLPFGQWQRLKRDQDWLLVRVNRIEGGLPSVEQLRDRLVSDWSRAMEQRAVERAVEQIAARYRYDERP